MTASIPASGRTSAPRKTGARPGCLWLVIGAGLLSLGALAILVLLLFVPRPQIDSDAGASPRVQIRLPSPGVRMPAQDEQLVLIQAYGAESFVRYELWIDGSLARYRTPSDPTSVNTNAQQFLWRPGTPGAHVLVARAYDDRGRIATSRPVVVEAVAGVRPPTIDISIETKPGDTLTGIAAAFNVSLDTIRDKNPGVPEAPAPGTILIVSLPSDRIPTDYRGDDEEITDPLAPDSGLPPPPAPRGTGEGLAIRVKDGTGDGPLSGFGASQPPAAPAALDITLTGGCNLQLKWSDNSDSETGFRVYRYDGDSRDFYPIAEFGTNQEFATLVYDDRLPLGGSYQYYVASMNAAGETPGPISQIDIPPESCSPRAPLDVASGSVRLQFEVINLATTPAGAHEDVYCYLSLEIVGQEYIRVPYSDDMFLARDQDGWNLEDYAAGINRIVFTQSPDKPVPVAIECWGWSGGELVGLGSFAASHPREDWDVMIPRDFIGTGIGEGGEFQVVYRIQPYTNGYRAVAYSHHNQCPSSNDLLDIPLPHTFGRQECDPNLNAPTDVRIPADEDDCMNGHVNLPGGNSEWGGNMGPLGCFFYTDVVVWEWQGEPSEITGYLVEYSRSGPHPLWVDTTVDYPSSYLVIGSMAQVMSGAVAPTCGGTLTVRVAAFAYERFPDEVLRVSEGGSVDDPPYDHYFRISPWSSAYSIYGPPCPTQAQVKFTLENLHVED
ncbi:MAG: LysM domain-containing protein, partial [Chloroflexota bacterium]